MASDSSRVWSIMSLVAGIGAATVTRKALNKSWQAASGRQPPQNPADPDVGLAEAVVWASLTGAAIALARMLAQRRAANYYTKSTGHLPPDLKKDDQRA